MGEDIFIIKLNKGTRYTTLKHTAQLKKTVYVYRHFSQEEKYFANRNIKQYLSNTLLLRKF